MTTMNDFIKTNDVDDILASVINNLQPSILRSQFNNAESLSATRTLADTDTPIQRLNCNGANRIVKMPTANTTDNHPYFIVNSTSSGTYTLTVQNNAGTSVFAILTPDEYIFLVPDGNGGYKHLVVSSDKYPMDFRLTLTSGTPVTTSDVTGATTLYCAPYIGNQIALYDGSSAWKTYTSTQMSLALGTMTSGLPYDVFCYPSSGTPTLEKLAWTSTSARATALTTQNGVLVKTGDTSRRYLGTFYTTSTTQTEDSDTKRFLWNYYNRVDGRCEKTDSTSHTYTTGSYRYWNNSSTHKVEFVTGYAEDANFVYLNGRLDANSGETAILSFGIDTSSTSSSGSNAVNAGPTATVNIGGIAAGRSTISSAGYHYVAVVEYGSASSADYVTYILTVLLRR